MLTNRRLVYHLIQAIMAATLTVGIAAPAVVTLGTTPLVAKAADQKYQNGTYDVQTSFKKQDDQNQDSLAQGFLNKGATLVVENGKLQLKITTTNDGGKYIKDMKVDGQTEYATIDHDGNNATITFTLPNTSGSYLIDMNLNTPMGAMSQKAYLKVDFSTVKTQATASSSSSSAASSASSASASAASSSSSSAKSATASSSATSSSTQASSTKASSNTSTTQPSSATNTDNAETRVLSIMKSSDPTQQSASAGFFAKQVTIKQDGNDYLITFTLSSGNGYIKSMTLNGEQPTATTANGDTGTYTYKVSAAVLAKGSATLAFALQTPLGAMNETALAVFPGTGKSTSDVVNDAAKATTDEPVTLISNGPVIDTTKEVQDVEYEVLNAAKSGVSEANAYYTHTARVTKSGSGYNVTLTVKVKSGIVSFTPLSVGAGPIVNTTKTSSGGDDIWTYTFYVADPTVLDNPVAASIRMSVPIANISNQTFSIWLVFGKTATNTRSYLDALSGDGTSGGTLTSTGLTGSGSAIPLAGSASPMATALQSGTGTVQNFDLAAAQKKIGKYAVKPGVSKMVEASLIKYPIAAALTFFIVAALIVIGVATTWRQRIVKKVRGLIHEA
ncbi:NEAT domain-containing protein [Limosilactobacillus fermentum]|jgi:heme-binding NEAT domain protein|uniref:NEAT domain-containing protein n=1 Tax=Limosilactobacillus fermentum TaxID=1613 RepID=UPI002731CCDF|nr:NEAT domain-containing protein [Limosilactobacillus fermentum]MDQ2153543.1 NEAT domain-containing protein [Limosilactobacillus fermentum]WLF75429.1 NEAT domain-containing protein [Limosilactobacillus fermentum]